MRAFCEIARVSNLLEVYELRLSLRTPRSAGSYGKSRTAIRRFTHLVGDILAMTLRIIILNFLNRPIGHRHPESGLGSRRLPPGKGDSAILGLVSRGNWGGARFSAHELGRGLGQGSGGGSGLVVSGGTDIRREVHALIVVNFFMILSPLRGRAVNGEVVIV